MTDLSIFLGFYLFLDLFYWISYIKIRPHIKKSNKHLLLFLSNMFLGLFLIGFLPVYLYNTKQIDHPLVLFLAFTMSLASLFHHLGFLRHIQPWRGFITPKGEKVDLIHGVVSHLMFAISYIFYGLLVLYYFSFKTILFSEKFFLYILIISVEFVAFLVLFDGIRMWYARKS